MKKIRTLLALGAVAAFASVPAAAWSLLDEVAIVDASLSAQMDFEMPVAKPYCESSPPNLDRMACEINPKEDFWFGVDAAGNHYGVVVVAQPSGEFFDIMRRPPGTQSSVLVFRVTKRIEPIFGEVTKASDERILISKLLRRLRCRDAGEHQVGNESRRDRATWWPGPTFIVGSVLQQTPRSPDT